MNLLRHYRHLLGGLLALSGSFALGWSSTVFAHGGEDHGGEDHSEAPPAAVVTSGLPKIEARSDQLELLGIYEGGVLTLYIDDYATNAPITGATVEATTDTQTEKAKEATPGVYNVQLPLLEKSAVHLLVFTIEGGQVGDLLEGKLDTRKPAAAATPSRSWDSWREWGIGAAGALMLVVIVYKFRRRAVMTALMIAVMAPAYSPPVSAHGGEDHSHDEAPATPLSGDAPRRLADGKLFIPKPTQRLLKVRTFISKEESSFHMLTLNGRIIPDPSASGVVQAGQAGRLEPGPNGLPTLGQKVAAGQVLAYLAPLASSLERGNQQAALVELDSQLSLAEKTRARLDALIDSVPQKDIDAAREDVKSLRQRREALANSLYQKEPLISPVNGVVGTMEVVVGQVVTEGTLLFTILQPEKLWVEALSYDPILNLQKDGATLKTGDISAKLSLVGAASSLRDQSVPVNFRVEAPVPALPIGQPVTVLVSTQTVVKGVPVPADAVTRNAEGQMVVWVHEKAELFRPVAVVTQALDGQRIMVTSGLEAGVRVVREGAGSLGQIR